MFTGLAMVERSCQDSHQLLADPRNYAAIYPLVEKTKILEQKRDVTMYEMWISVGAGTTSQVLRLERRPGRVLHSSQDAGHSSWHFVEAGPGRCILQFTHDENITRDSTVLRLALAGKGAIVEGIQAAVAVGNVRNVRSHLAKGAKARRLEQKALGEALARVARVGTAAFLPHLAGVAPVVAARAGQAPQRALAEASRSDSWGSDMPLFYGKPVAERADGRRRMQYTLKSLFEDVEFETWQEVGPSRVREEVIGGELSRGGWAWTTFTDELGVTLLLSMRLDIAEGDWLVGKLMQIDRTAEEGTLLGISFMLVEQVARRAAARKP